MILLLVGCAIGGEPGLAEKQFAFATRDGTGFEKLGPPKPGEWRWAHPERK